MKAVLRLSMLVLAAQIAHAEAPLPPGGWTVAMPLDEVVGDGQTPVKAHVLVLRDDGSPVEDLEVKLKSKTAKAVSGWTYEGGGIYSFLVTPPQVEGSDVTWVAIKGKTPEKDFKVDLAAKLPLRKTPPLALTMASNPSQLVAGETEESTLTFTLADGRNVDPKMLRVRTTRGEVGELAAMGNGRYVGKLVVDDAREPGLALVTVSDKRRPERMYGALTLTITAKRTISARAPHGASVLLKVGGREFGPVESKGGRARIDDVVLPPGVTEATQVTVKDGNPEESALDLNVRPAKRLLFVPTFEGIPGDPALEVPIRLLVVTADGKPDSSAKPVLETDAGEISAVRHEGRGVYLATFKPAASGQARTVKLTAKLPDEKGQVDTIDLNITPARPAALDVAVEPNPLGEARSATVSVKATAQDGAILPARVSLNLTGAKEAGAWSVGKEQGTGSITTFGGPVEMRVSALTPASGNPLHQLVVVPTKHWLANDKISSTMLTVVALDVFGYPVEGVPVDLHLESGDGSLPKQVTTDANGLAQVFYTAGQDVKIVRIRASSGEASAAVPIIQAPVALKDVTLPVSGSDDQRALREAWAKSIVTLRVETE